MQHSDSISSDKSEAIVNPGLKSAQSQSIEFVILTQNRMPQATVNAAEGFTPVVNAHKRRGFYPQSDREKGDLFPCSVSSRSSDSRTQALKQKKSLLLLKKMMKVLSFNSIEGKKPLVFIHVICYDIPDVIPRMCYPNTKPMLFQTHCYDSLQLPQGLNPA